jgi:hypothetical protein
LIKLLMFAAGICIAQIAGATGCAMPEQVTDATPQQVHDFFSTKHLKVVSFFGYSGAEYEDHAGMLARVRSLLAHFDPRTTVINVGATKVGIGAVYELAKQAGFMTSGIVSSQARDQSIALSPCVDHVFYIQDSTWGGYMSGTTTLSPTSQAMVLSSDVLIAIGGGEIARDELLEAKRMGKDVRFFPADLNHGLARQKAAAKGLPEPTDFRGEAYGTLSGI